MLDEEIFPIVHSDIEDVSLGDGDGAASADLIDPKRNDGAAGAHDIAVTGVADLGLAGHPGLGDRDLLLDRLGHAHGVDGIGRLVGRETDDALHPLINSSGQHIIRTDNVSAYRLHGEELAGGHLFQRCRVEDVVDAGHGIPDGLRVAHVADVELDLAGILRVVGLQLVAHVVLLLLIAGEDADLADVGGQEMLEHCMPEAARAAGDE